MNTMYLSSMLTAHRQPEPWQAWYQLTFIRLDLIDLKPLQPY